ncbi:putative membrane protein [Inquilinus ginsengisoli]|uniref:Membrane protein n=1 Tax=Inquilinus ginsengisoli TaxID=363840 RepID=A0ABU1JJG7_9PROT|nr:lysylphosphatidylglycerol synthase domain-containing protein [Inquilinus ginsengisoli]MDR6288761.1 putative membrane protein [Inquilinus ginsengisoli]
MKRQAIKLATALVGLAGLLGIIGLIVSQDASALLNLLLGASGGILLVVAAHILPMMCSALGWRAAMRPLWSAGFGTFLWARLVRESANAVLPVAQVGGDVLGARVLALHGARTVQAGAGMLVDLTLEFLTQILFFAIGLSVLVLIGGGDMVRLGGLGLAVAILTGIAFVLAQRWGMFRLFERLLGRIAQQFDWPALGSLSGLHDTVISIYRDRRAMAEAAAGHLASWLLGAGEVWLTLHVLGADIGFAEALVMESLGQAVRTAAFLIPGALGVQDGAFLALGVMFGLPPEIGLSVSLVKRIRELVLHAPALLIWYLLEGRRLLRTPEDARGGQA